MERVTKQLPRIIVGATGSGCGKTTITCGILKLLTKRGKKCISFKCGPDYIDPMFHKRVLGIESRNLDLFFNEPREINGLMASTANRYQADIAVLEGVMGYYDGMGGTTSKAGTYDLASKTKTPAVLIVDARGKSRSILAEIKGFCQLEQESMIRGIILNRVSPMMYPLLKKLIEEEMNRHKEQIKVLGYLPKLDAAILESRHLGLVTADEIEDIDRNLEELSQLMEETIDIDGLLSVAETAPNLDIDLESALEFDLEFQGSENKQAKLVVRRENQRNTKKEPVKIAVARDKAFCFYYEDNMDMLRREGAEIVEFSPLHDECLPKDIGGLMLGGGYPELYGSELEGNHTMRADISRALAEGLPCLGECGGFMYLHEWIENEEGKPYEGIGFFTGSCKPTGKLVRFGYINLTANENTLICKAGESIRAHEFHYWESSDPGNLFLAKKPMGNRSWACIKQSKSTLAGYPHLNYRSNKEVPKQFVRACREYLDSKR